MTLEDTNTNRETRAPFAVPRRRAATSRRLAALVASLLLLLAAAHAHAARPQNTGRVQLPAGRAVTVRGTLRPGTSEASVEYVFRAKAGQKISLRLNSNRVAYGAGETAGAVFFVVNDQDQLPPDFGDYPYGGPTNWTGVLPTEGTYRVRVRVEDGPDDPSPEALRRLRRRIRYTLQVTFPRR